MCINVDVSVYVCFCVLCFVGVRVGRHDGRVVKALDWQSRGTGFEPRLRQKI